MIRARLYAAILDPTAARDDIRAEIDLAINGLRQAGDVEFVAKALLTAALHESMKGESGSLKAKQHLDEAQQIAERGPMPLYLADVHLHRARLFRDRDELAKARALIEKYGYGRRNEELADAEEATRSW